AKPGDTMDIDVVIAVEGHQITQARALCHVGNREILTVNAALGHRDIDLGGQWEQMPPAAPPLECEERSHLLPPAGYLHDHVEQRWVTGRAYADLGGTHGS
ncbi:MAG TPA: acyl-CoA thioesterase, partial [Ilumatobacteraceae bacterium]|nr:acyl-CoA thioesterase [Ilumatobacteraceae bacterium]